MESISTVGKQTQEDLAILAKSGLLEKFYLAGGTGLAFSFNHRESHDLDFFTESDFNIDYFISKLILFGDFAIGLKGEGTLRGTFNKTIVSFFYYPYPLIDKLIEILNVHIASPEDIACMKIDAVSSRGTKKDFIDIYFIIKEKNLSLPEILSLFETKYRNLKYNMMHIQKSLVYFTDADDDPMPRMIKSVSWDEIRQFFIDEVRKL